LKHQLFSRQQNSFLLSTPTPQPQKKRLPGFTSLLLSGSGLDDANSMLFDELKQPVSKIEQDLGVEIGLKFCSIYKSKQGSYHIKK